MTTKAERQWFDKHAQELVDTQAAPYGPDLIATLPDNTTYSVAGDHGGIQRAAQEIPIVFAGAGLSDKDVKAPVRSVDIMPTILKAMGITPTARHGRSRLPAAAGEVALAGRLPKGGPVGLGWCVMQPSESDRAALQFIAACCCRWSAEPQGTTTDFPRAWNSPCRRTASGASSRVKRRSITGLSRPRVARSARSSRSRGVARGHLEAGGRARTRA